MPYFEPQPGVKLFFLFQQTDASKPALVFLNGITQACPQWRPQMKAFQDAFRVLLYDARCQGRSDTGDRAPTLQVHAADLRELLDHLQIVQAHLVGLSHGAHVAAHLAATTPERVNRLVLCSVGAAPSARARLAVRAWRETLRLGGLEALAWTVLPTVLGEDFLHRKRAVTEEIVAALVQRNRQEALLTQLEAMDHYPPLSQAAAKIDRPTLVLSGADDPLVPRASALRLAGLCHGGHTELAGTGHTLPLENPDQFNAAIREFLQF